MSRTHLLSFPLKSYLLLRHPSARDNRQNLFTGLIRSNLFHSTFNLTLFVCLSREDNARSHACRHFKCSVQRELGATKSIDASRNLDFSSFLPSNSIRLSSALHATCAFSLSLLFYDKVEHPLSAALSLKLLFCIPTCCCSPSCCTRLSLQEVWAQIFAFSLLNVESWLAGNFSFMSQFRVYAWGWPWWIDLLMDAATK